MTSFAQLEMLLSNLPSDIVGHIHGYAKHPVAEIFKEAESSGKICMKHPALRLIESCVAAYEMRDYPRFIRSYKLLTWHQNRNAALITGNDWPLLREPFRELFRLRNMLFDNEDFTRLYNIPSF